MESFRSPEVLRPTHEFRPELEPEREGCLQVLMGEAVGRQIDPDADSHLIEQINDAVTEVNDGVAELACRIPGCSFRCLTTSEDGISELHDKMGQCVREE